MSTVVERLKQTTQVLRSKIDEERNLYMKHKGQLELYYPNEWKVVAEAIKTVALYCNGEIARAKHDVADWMNGHEVHGTYGDLDSIDMLHECLDYLLVALDAAGKAADRYNREQHDPVKAGTAKMDAEAALGEVKAALELIQDMAKNIEERCYAER